MSHYQAQEQPTYYDAFSMHWEPRPDSEQDQSENIMDTRVPRCARSMTISHQPSCDTSVSRT